MSILLMIIVHKIHLAQGVKHSGGYLITASKVTTPPHISPPKNLRPNVNALPLRPKAALLGLIFFEGGRGGEGGYEDTRDSN